MNKILPIVLAVALGGVVVFGVFKVLQSFGKPETRVVDSKNNKKAEEVLRELPIEERPFVSLIPRADGHELHMTITKIPSDAGTIEYKLVYKDAKGISQGVPGTVKAQFSIERDLVLGTCSSGKCRYDEGVEEGNFTIRLRNVDGKLIAKLETPFYLQKGGKELNFLDGSFSLTAGNLSKNAYYLTMSTLGLPGQVSGKVVGKPYGVFTKGSSTVSASVQIKGEGSLYTWNGSKWSELKDNKATSFGVFVKASAE